MKFRECDAINSKENIQAGYRNGSRIVNWLCVNKTSLNYDEGLTLETSAFLLFTVANLRFHFTKLPAILSHQRSTTVSLETYPFTP